MQKRENTSTEIKLASTDFLPEPTVLPTPQNARTPRPCLSVVGEIRWDFDFLFVI
jgi:hypothetical protein